MNCKIGLIGRVAEQEKLFDGQTVKTRSLKEMLIDLVGTENVYVVDTYNYKKRIFSVIICTFMCLVKCDKIVLSISINGRRVFFPLLYYMNKIFHKEVYHSLIGGRLVDNINRYPSWKKYVNSFASNWVETHELVRGLEEIDVNNAVYIPNFKNINLADNNHFEYCDGNVFRFCTFSRVQELKGITFAINTIKKINEKITDKIIYLDIYGPIDDEYKSEFEKLIQENSEVISYKGCVNATESVSFIKDYYMLLFPTKYFNEGIPGTIIDAMAAGLPVIASRWHYCDEMIEHMKNGLVYEFYDDMGLENMIEYAVYNPNIIKNMKNNCLIKAEEYMYENVIEKIKIDMKI